MEKEKIYITPEMKFVSLEHERAILLCSAESLGNVRDEMGWN